MIGSYRDENLDVLTCSKCNRIVGHNVRHICVEQVDMDEIFGQVEQRSANLDDLLSELKLVSSLLTHILQILSSTE